LLIFNNVLVEGQTYRGSPV